MVDRVMFSGRGFTAVMELTPEGVRDYDEVNPRSGKEPDLRSAPFGSVTAVRIDIATDAVGTLQIKMRDIPRPISVTSLNAPGVFSVLPGGRKYGPGETGLEPWTHWSRV